MAESKMKEVAKLLGVEWGVPFKVKNSKGEYLRYNPYVFEDNDLCDRDNDCADRVLWELLKGEYEIEKPILDDVEKRYLEGVLRPFKDRVIYIIKGQVNDEYLYISLERFNCIGDEGFSLPYFEPNYMYKGMELDKEYTLEELGLFQD